MFHALKVKKKKKIKENKACIYSTSKLCQFASKEGLGISDFLFLLQAPVVIRSMYSASQQTFKCAQVVLDFRISQHNRSEFCTKFISHSRCALITMLLNVSKKNQLFLGKIQEVFGDYASFLDAFTESGSAIKGLRPMFKQSGFRTDANFH